ncbi:MAG: hypothetical protein WAT71_06695 [Ignavibacteria bacterium]
MNFININPILNEGLEITSGINSWDLRNDADFSRICYFPLESIVILTWEFPSDWYKKEYGHND